MGEELVTDLLNIVAGGEMEMDRFNALRRARSLLAKYQANLNTEQQSIFENGILCGKLQFFVDAYEHLASKEEVESCLHDETLMKILKVLEEGAMSHAQLAQSLHISPTALSNIFNKHTYYYNYIYLVLSDEYWSIQLYSLNKKGRQLLLMKGV